MVRKQRTWSLVQGALWIVLVVISIFDGGWRWVTTVYAVGCVVFLTQGILADVELNRREHRNYPPTDPDGLRHADDVAER
jgi:hypothetical protein